jgi:hypothetical protein
MASGIIGMRTLLKPEMLPDHTLTPTSPFPQAMHL